MRRVSEAYNWFLVTTSSEINVFLGDVELRKNRMVYRLPSLIYIHVKKLQKALDNKESFVEGTLRSYERATDFFRKHEVSSSGNSKYMSSCPWYKYDDNSKRNRSFDAFFERERNEKEKKEKQ